ncbi:hypothetical protein K470DRAFT_258972 [Piedraia hortae CBS 480.64]|uniref:Ubiquitin-conjugating enzyme E2 2 n=1 Tax=Piedraia hortae CBS 480.64 TaxID=1314780 RepID=A0A6A7BXA9_9PEZI|nr:hypothetical protein K470DRAFT_258972 [Piedraia hortae CBS 480.64]
MASTTSSTAGNGVKGTGDASAPSPNLIKRLQSELLTFMSSPTPGISAFPSEGAQGPDMMNWNATIAGPSDTDYADKTFKLTIAYPTNYPYAPPVVRFRTPVYHPNIDFSGRICLSILDKVNGEGGWSAALNTANVLLCVQSLLGEPNPSSPLNAEAARLWETDREEYKRKVQARHQEPEEVNNA